MKQINWVFFAGIVLIGGLFLSGCVGTSRVEPTPQSTPDLTTPLPASKITSVSIDAGAPLVCDLLETPKQIGEITATYSCAAPGAFLESTDAWTLTAKYFTTNSQATQVTYGPTEVKITDYTTD